MARAKVTSACRDCRKCQASAASVGARNLGRGTAALMTVGMSEAGMAFMPKCRVCGHQRSLHGVAASGPQPIVQVVHQEQAEPSGPPPGFYSDGQNLSAKRWWDGQKWTDVYQ